ncbi:MAG: hypothetical protein JJ894_09220 [Dinoroseobacter sp.]|nr:hypothetical protein [Dinoroseobacter sp.]
MDIDPLPLIYYGIICAFLTGFTPRLIGIKSRMILGGAAGVAAAFWWPEIQQRFGGIVGW